MNEKGLNKFKRGVDNQYKYMLNLSRVKDNWFQNNDWNVLLFCNKSRIRDKNNNDESIVISHDY